MAHITMNQYLQQVDEALQQGRGKKAAPALSCCKLFTKIFQSLKEENWALPIMYTVCLDLRVFASQADTQLSKKSKGKPGETLEKAAEYLMGCFRVCASDNRSSLENSKRQGMLNLVNQLFKIYFKEQLRTVATV
ncbi:hypothetical protein HPB51_008547 [Rhipicephalus microplus]|uniref:Uncharacterized protein n=1 Tax=Rhipicephalus microplus TaxID=6941 RepID=A0A9J6D4J2_RHIMP|nr:hypothetical protein HPB51_008547 [Rhipicephalus microplus]